MARPMTPRTLRWGTREVRATVDAGGVQIDDQRFTVTAAAPGVYVVDDGTRQWQVAVADAANARWVSVNGQVAVIDVGTTASAGPRPRRAAADSMMSPMPATVVKVLVEPGRTIAAGEVVLVLEAMKMELPIRSPRDGVVAAVRCTQGELVQPGVALVELE
jgi:biotin carboxyl carrier protein